ncbi:MAG: hypothetical protein M3Q69_00060 [Acidobacteriota bacterium]|nr:hypothetical protein [Acidobacteriota bacterium]
MKKQDLFGRWKRIEGSAPYPEALTFHPDGNYRAEATDGPTVWDVGTFRLSDDDADNIVLSDWTDREVSYPVTAAGDEITLRDAEGRTLRYRRD